ncbi:hypothetical protein [Burkholderia ubonensis]|nr:hypothetical protein [Burkholderia ubonensis]
MHDLPGLPGFAEYREAHYLLNNPSRAVIYLSTNAAILRDTDIRERRDTE